jgi:hypothetical protein
MVRFNFVKDYKQPTTPTVSVFRFSTAGIFALLRQSVDYNLATLSNHTTIEVCRRNMISALAEQNVESRLQRTLFLRVNVQLASNAIRLTPPIYTSQARSHDVSYWLSPRQQITSLSRDQPTDQWCVILQQWEES